MTIYRSIHVNYWQDPFVLKLTPEQKFFYLYLMTNSKTTQCGIYEISKQVMSLETGYNTETLEKLLKIFVENGKIQYCEETNEIMLMNWIKYNKSESPKVKACIVKELSNVKNPLFIEKFCQLCVQYGYSIDTVSILNPNNNKNNNKNNKKNNNKEEEKEITVQKNEPNSTQIYQDILDHFNQTFSDLYSPLRLTKKKIDQLRLRLKTFTINEIKTAITNCHDDPSCRGNNRTGWKADWDYLFRNDERIDKYLNYKGKGDNQLHGKESEYDWLLRK